MCQLCKLAEAAKTEQQMQDVLNRLASQLTAANYKKKQHLNQLMDKMLGFSDTAEDTELAEAWERGRRGR
jgi:hypothetical protein